MKLKLGVSVLGIKPEILLAVIVAERIWSGAGVELVVTSCTDGQHSRGSKHYAGCAVDIRTHGLPDAPAIVQALGEALGPGYDVLLEGVGTPGEHCHVEWDPKTP